MVPFLEPLPCLTAGVSWVSPYLGGQGHRGFVTCDPGTGSPDLVTQQLRSVPRSALTAPSRMERMWSSGRRIAMRSEKGGSGDIEGGHWKATGRTGSGLSFPKTSDAETLIRVVARFFAMTSGQRGCNILYVMEASRDQEWL